MYGISHYLFYGLQTNYTGASSVFGFEAFLTPFDFKQQLEVSFGVRLSPAEVGMDPDLILANTFSCLY